MILFQNDREAKPVRPQGLNVQDKQKNSEHNNFNLTSTLFDIVYRALISTIF